MYNKRNDLRKIIMVVFILFLFVLGLSGTIYLSVTNINNQPDEETKEEMKENSPSINELKTPDFNEFESKNDKSSNGSSNTETKVDSKNEIITKPPVESNIPSNPPDNSTNNNFTPSEIKPSIDEPSENQSKEDMKPIEKKICEDNNEEWLNYKRDFQKKHSKFMIFNSQNEAISYGEYAAMKFGYGYYYDSVPLKFEGSNCKREFWTTNLYTGELNCGENDEIIVPSFDLPATEKENLVSVYDYANSKGFNCQDRTWVPIP